MPQQVQSALLGPCITPAMLSNLQTVHLDVAMPMRHNIARLLRHAVDWRQTRHAVLTQASHHIVKLLADSTLCV